MKKILFLLIGLATILECFSQNMVDTIHPLFKGDINGDSIRRYLESTYSSPVNFQKNSQTVPTLRFVAFYSNSLSITGQMAHEKIPALKLLETNTSRVYEMPSGGYAGKYAIPIFDSTGIIITVSGINRKNAADYEYRVLENKTTAIIPWRSCNLFCESYYGRRNPDGTDEKETAYLGQFRTSWGNNLLFQVRRKESPEILITLAASWINRAPSVLGVFRSGDMPAFLSVFKDQWEHDLLIKHTPAERMAKDSQFVLLHEFGPTENTLIFYLDDKVRSKEIIEYNLDNTDWKINDFDLNLIWLKDLSPGKHRLQIRYSLQRQNITVYNFTIAAAWHQTILFKITLGILALALVGFILLLFRTKQQKAKRYLEQLRKQQTESELKSIRAQFNPHFVFNALSSIQGLITKNDTDNADKYLTEFSTLLRDSLKESGNESTSLAKEISMLSTYLELEKLRFGFNYTIATDKEIDINAVEIPSLLIQPLIENAVKHGVAAKYERGELTIRFKKSSADLIILIEDNGEGFDPGKTTTGYGLKITQERIDLLNKLSTNQHIDLSFTPSETGTSVCLLFKNRFA